MYQKTAGQHTLLRHTPALVRVKLLRASSTQHCGVAPGACQCDLHRLLEELKALDLLDGGVRRLGFVEDDKGLTFGLKICLGYNVNHIAKLGKDGAQCLLEPFGFDAFLQVADVNPAS